MHMFGVLILDREPLTRDHLPGLIQVWLQDAGGFAAVGLLVYLAYALFAPSEQPESTRLRMPVTSWMLLMGVASLLCYAVFAALFIGKIGAEEVVERSAAINTDAAAYVPPKLSLRPQPVALALGGLCALLGIGHPFARDLFKLSARRTLAIAKLCVKEAVRDKLYLLLIISLMVFQFPIKWFVSQKPEDEIRMSLDVTAAASALFLLVPAVIIAAFRIPKDIKDQTIYTIVTKPVERFEIVLGRFLGYGVLITLALALMTLAGWVYLTFATTFNPKAVEESQRSRVPLRGKIDFKARTADYSGTNVGREFEYRKYIGGAKSTTERALWMFDRVPASLASADRDQVPCEMTFDIFKLTKGEENRGVDINIRVVSWQTGQRPPEVRGGEGAWLWTDADKEKAYKEERAAIDEKLRKKEIGGPNAPPSLAFARPGTEAWKEVDRLAEKYGFFEIGSTEVYDYHPATVYLPPGLFRKAREGAPPAGEPRVTVYVKCLSPGQMLGMAPGDLYLMEGEKTFTENYFKNAVGLWCRAIILVGVAVTLSTYLSGVISLLAAAFLYISAYFAEHLRDVATGQSIGGGPLESFKRLLNADTPTAPTSDSAASRFSTAGDKGLAWVFRRFENIVPNIDAFTWTNYLKEGFNINAEYLAVNLLILIGYLLPWALLSYYLIRNREVAA